MDILLKIAAGLILLALIGLFVAGIVFCFNGMLTTGHNLFSTRLACISFSVIIGVVFIGLICYVAEEIINNF